MALAALAGVLVLALVRAAATGAIDYPFTSAVNQMARRWPALDDAMLLFERFNAPKGVALMALAYAAFSVARSPLARWRLVIGCFAASAAAVASRLVQLVLPNLPRPLFDPALRFTPPYGADLQALHDWSSYPSDNAALLFGLACAVLLANRRIGLLALAVFAISGFARIYGGLHYLTDILGGALLGAAFVLAVSAADLSWLERLNGFVVRHRVWFAGLAFFAAVQAASLFDEVRAAAGLFKAWIA
jgi:undecaprenyl-diphosphatase